MSKSWKHLGAYSVTILPRAYNVLLFKSNNTEDSSISHFQGVKFLRRFKQLLNPAQVFDLMNGGPHPG